MALILISLRGSAFWRGALKHRTFRYKSQANSAQSPLGTRKVINAFLVELDSGCRTSLRAAARPNRCISRPTWICCPLERERKTLRSGATLEGPTPPPAPDTILERVATLCDAVVNRLTLTHDPDPASTSLRPQSAIPTYRGYNDRQSVPDYLDRLQSPFQSWAAFRQRFREEFLPPGHESRILQELDLRTQHPDESLLEYVRAIKESLLHELQCVPHHHDTLPWSPAAPGVVPRRTNGTLQTVQ
ncbi:hypothetical protein HPB47_017947 [Ixodes persulcatus]|uniref:Uncharacterized protein n=1 Tax=Ixodes persulcatus TaxID=34615 RepID=A0AC60QLZ9_IXOPE|nr:hypothetical protein HPB47_017947 [Ixodes persulcatus]